MQEAQSQALEIRIVDVSIDGDGVCYNGECSS